MYRLDVLPPIYILFLIYGQYYSKISVEDRKQITLFSNELTMINKYFNLQSVQAIPEVKDIFNRLFPRSTNGGMRGGDAPSLYGNNPYSSYNSSPYNSYPSLYGNNAFKSLNSVNPNIASGPPSNLSYHINVELILYPGTSIPLSKRPSLICEGKYADVRRNWNAVFGNIDGPRPSTSIIKKTNANANAKTDNDKNVKTGGKKRYTRKHGLHKKYTRKNGIRKKYTRKHRLQKKYTRRTN